MSSSSKRLPRDMRDELRRTIAIVCYENVSIQKTMKRADIKKNLFDMFHGKGMEVVSQVDQFLTGRGIYKEMFDSATITTVTDSSVSPASNTILSLKERYNSLRNTKLILGTIINREILVRANFRSTDLCSGRFLYEQILMLQRNYKKALSFALKKVDDNGNTIESGTTLDDAWTLCSMKCLRRIKN